jgi:hypothetical protein
MAASVNQVTGSKLCRKCGLVKPLEQFYGDRTHSDGRQSKCKDCASQYSKLYIENNRGKVNARLKRWVASNRERRREISRRWYARNAESHKAYIKRYRKDNWHKVRAHELVAYAVSQGELIRSACEKCGAVPTEAHHDDYSKPLSVRWLCKLHHEAEHHYKGE